MSQTNYPDQSDDEGLEPKPEQDDIFITPSGQLGSKTSLSCGGKFVGEFDDNDEALQEAKKWMDEHKFYPTIWWVSDHGNHWPIDIEGKEIK